MEQLDFSNFNKWEVETTQFLRDTMGIPKPTNTPLQAKNSKLYTLMNDILSPTYVYDSNKLMATLLEIYQIQ
jgi:hypothetical protein